MSYTPVDAKREELFTQVLNKLSNSNDFFRRKFISQQDDSINGDIERKSVHERSDLKCCTNKQGKIFISTISIRNFGSVEKDFKYFYLLCGVDPLDYLKKGQLVNTIIRNTVVVPHEYIKKMYENKENKKYITNALVSQDEGFYVDFPYLEYSFKNKLFLPQYLHI